VSFIKSLDIAQLARLSKRRLVLYAVLFAVLSTSLIVAGMDYLLNGEVTLDYMLTGLVASLCVSALISSLLVQLASIQKALDNSLSESTEHQTVIQQQLQTNSLLQSVIETLPIRVFWKDRQLHYLGCNSLFARDAGYDSPSQILGKNDFQLSWKTQAALYRADDQQVMSSNQAKLAYEEPQTTPDGKPIVLRTSKTPLHAADGKVIGVLGIYEDITALKHIERELWLNQTAIAKSSSSFYRIDSQGIILSVNDHVCETLGYAREAIIGRPVWDFDPDFPAQAWPPLWDKLKKQGHINIETRHRRQDGSIFPVEVIGNYINHHGEEHTFTFVQDISQRKQIEQQLRLTQFAMDNASLGIYWVDAQAHICYANQHASDMLGYSREQLLTLQLADIDPVFPFQNWADHWRALQHHKTQVFETHHRRSDGQLLVVEIIANHVHFADTEYSVVFAHEITARKQAEEKQLLASRVFSEAHEGIAITDAQGNIVDVNPTFCEITGYSRNEVIGQNPRILSSGKHTAEYFSSMWQTLYQQNYWQGEMWNRKKNGEIYAELLTISVLRDESGKIMHYLGLFSDITQSKQQQRALELMAHYDPLTQLPNRTLFADRFQQAIARSKRDETLLAICFMDLDGFKPVNDQYGHDAGDLVLIEVARRIKATLREEDTVSRMGGDEFALLLSDLESLEHCRQAMHRIHQAIAEPYQLGEHFIQIGASSGITLYPLDAADPDILLRHGDHAMYQAKLAGKNRFYLFEAGSEAPSPPIF